MYCTEKSVKIMSVEGK